MPISKERKDYVLAGLAVVIISAAAVLCVNLIRPRAPIMRQPRVTVCAALALIAFVTAVIFIGRAALPFFSRMIAWGFVAVAGVSLVLVLFFNHLGHHSFWFRFFMLCFCFLLGSTLLAELMIFYRRFFHNRPFRTAIWHKILFALVIATITFGMGAAYYHKAVSGGLIINYPKSVLPQTPSSNTPSSDSPVTVPTSPLTAPITSAP